MRGSRLLIIITILFGINGFSLGQELEPRALTNLPLKTQFAVAGYQYMQGNLLFDPSTPIEDANARLHTLVFAYARAIKIFGLSGKIDAVLPYGISDWEGSYLGVDTAISRNGFADLRARISVNFIGAPPLKQEEYASYKPDIIAGMSLQVFAPTGQYFEERLINLGINRWIFKPQFGVAKYLNRLILEFYTSLWLFTDNTDFWGGNYVKTKPMLAFKAHGIWAFQNRTWLALSTGYAIGSRSYINEVLKENRISTLRIALNYSVPLAPQHTLKLTAISAVRFERGPDFDALSLVYQYRW